METLKEVFVIIVVVALALFISVIAVVVVGMGFACEWVAQVSRIIKGKNRRDENVT